MPSAVIDGRPAPCAHEPLWTPEDYLTCPEVLGRAPHTVYRTVPGGRSLGYWCIEEGPLHGR